MNPLTIETLEICIKETEETLRSAGENFLKEPISYLKTRMTEFLYVESPDFNDFKVDSLVLEVDDIFKTYMVLFGLQGKKKEGEAIRKYMEEKLQHDLIGLSISFSDTEGLWEINMPLDSLEGFTDDMAVGEVLELLYEVISGLSRMKSAQ